ncbi:hypothetical protein acdb102_27350 [Acidothermaceae bacterium B102]|nr:hypothetical protein acdb102_27350 [Acidothermaceae bacterium B102]
MLVALSLGSSLVGLSAPAAFAAKSTVARVVLGSHVASVVAKRQAKGAPLGSVSVTGKITPARTGRVVLQRKTGTGWRDVGKASLTAKATFTVRGTSLPVGKLTLRVVEVSPRKAPLASSRFSLLVRVPTVVMTLPLPPVPVPPPPSAPPTVPPATDPPVAVSCQQSRVGPQLGLNFAGLYPALGYVGQSWRSAPQVATTAEGWTLTAATGLPPGIALSGNVLRGTPTAKGLFTITLTVTDTHGATVSGDACVQFADPLALPTQTLPDASAGQPYDGVLAISGGFLPISLADDGGSHVTNGLTYANGALVGTPAEVGTHAYPLVVDDATRATAAGVVTLTVGPLPAARTLYVPGDAGTIQGAINLANPGDTILVGPGLYDENVDFDGKAIAVRSTAGAATTVIDGGGVLPGVRFHRYEPRSAVLDGFTVRNGRADDGVESPPPGLVLAGGGGGIDIDNASPTIEHNVVIDNIGESGAGVSADNGDAVIEDNVIAGNTDGIVTNTDGTGLYVGGVNDAEVIGNTIESNRSLDGNAGGVALQGGLLFQSNVVRDNYARGTAGGLVISGGPARVVDNLIEGNIGAEAVVVEVSASPVELLNDTIANNAGISLAVTGPHVNLVVRNSVISGSGASIACLEEDSNQIVLDHDDFAGLTVPAACGAFSPALGDTSAVPTYDGAGYVPAAGSALVDAGAADALLPATDLAGAARVVDGDRNGSATVDIGAYERQ